MLPTDTSLGVAHSLHFTEQQNMVHITTTRRPTLFNHNFCWVVGSCLCSAISIRCQIVSLIQRWNQKPHDNDCADVVLCSNLFPPVFHTPWNLFNFNIDRQWHKNFHKDKCMPYKLGGGLYPGQMRLGLAWECGSRGSNQDIERCLGWELRSRFSGAGAQCGKSGDDDDGGKLHFEMRDVLWCTPLHCITFYNALPSCLDPIC